MSAQAFASVLGVYAHPDDADVDAGATIARLARQGARVTLVVVTDGGAGGFEADGQSSMGGRRRAEQREAARALGVSEVVFLEGYADGHVKEDPRLTRDLVRQIRLWRPQLVLSLSPEYNWDSIHANHPDHRAVGTALVDAVYPAARNPFDYCDLLGGGLEAHAVAEVWFQGGPAVNHVVPVEERDLEAKVRAVRCHDSQFPDMDGIEAHIRAAAARAGNGLSGAPLGEGFFRWVVAG